MRYCDGRKLNFGQGKSAHDFSGHSNMRELKILMEENISINHDAFDLLSEWEIRMANSSSKNILKHSVLNLSLFIVFPNFLSASIMFKIEDL